MPDDHLAGLPLDAVAIVGIACRFADVEGPRDLWAALSSGRELVSRWETELAEGWVAAGGILRDPDHFDPVVFGMSPRESELTDPQQRTFLEVCWHALEDAGHSPQSFPGEIGVFAASGPNTYLPRIRAALGTDAGGEAAVVDYGNEKDFLAAKVSHRLGLHGPSIVVQTGCSSALTAVHLACQSLADYECDMAIAGGSSVSLDRVLGYRVSVDGLLSPDGQCRPFDQRANGMVPSDGVAAVVLRRLEDALADGDQITAVVLGSAVGNDGRGRPSFSALSVDGLISVQRKAYAVSGVDPATIGYIEPHGTGVQLGDPLEIAALSEVIGAAPNRQEPCFVGGSKGSLGHTDATSGLANLLVAALSLRNRTMLAVPHFQQPNGLLKLAGSGLEILTEQREWSPGRHPRRAAVNASSAGGANAHFVLQEAPETGTAPQSVSPRHLVPLSAATPQALHRIALRLAEHIDAHPQLTLTDIARTMQRGRTVLGHRAAVVASSAAELALRLRDSVTVEPAQAGARPESESDPLAQAVLLWVAEGRVLSHVAAGPGRVVTLPGYPFERRRFNIAVAAADHRRPAHLGEAVQPATGLESVLVEIWAGVLGVDAGVTDNFFELGGDSLAGLQVLKQVQLRLGRVAGIRDLFLRPTIRSLAELLARPADLVAAPITRAWRVTLSAHRSGDSD